MPGKLPNAIRDQAAMAFRHRAMALYRGQNAIEGLGWVPFLHQAKWIAASEGFLIEEGVERGDIYVPEDLSLSRLVQLPDRSIHRYAVVPRPGGPARVIADLGAFKIGKSASAGFWGAGFAAIPGARVQLIGLEYDTVSPEFDYLVDILLSEHGMNMKYDALSNRPRDGRMFLDIAGGARYEARSWERKESLKGKEIDAYIYCEAYQLPGIEAYTNFSQNLRARDGWAVFPTTPDRPWVQELHDRAHSGQPEWAKWHCTCGVDADNNPYTYDAEARIRDQQLMTREKFAIHYGGQLGDFVGRVFNYQRGQHQFNAASHPFLFKGGTDRAHFSIPEGWEVVNGADTGTYYTALSVAFSPEGEAFVFDEFPNYRYVAGSPERDEEISIPAWANSMHRRLSPREVRLVFWADSNSQFKQELRQYGITLLGGSLPVEARTEIAREYFQHGKIFLAPWLEVLPFELENAAWPEEASSSGKFARIKDRDHTLDCLEHVLAKRPRGSIASADRPAGSWLADYARKHGAKSSRAGNPHLGSL